MVFWRSFWIQNGHHSKPKWSQYGAACLTPCKYPFPLKSFYFLIFNDFFNFYIGDHFEMAAILKILKTKSTTLSNDLFLCQVSKGSAVWSKFNIFCTLVTMHSQKSWVILLMNIHKPNRVMYDVSK